MGDREYQIFESRQKARGIDLPRVRQALRDFQIETPSWGYGDSGTRFKVFRHEGAARNPYEKIEDAAVVHRLTGMCPTVAIHIPWDRVDHYGDLARYAESLGLRIGSVNPNLFQDDDYKFGSLTHPNPAVRRKAVHHLIECIDIMREVGSSILSLWLADGTNYPGQGDFRRRKHWILEGLHEAYERLGPDMRILIEYKFFEPAFYHTDLSDWGTALLLAQKLGPQADVLVDLGHHPQGTNVEHIVAILLDEGRLGGFHFNSRKYADDDLMTGTINPYELFLILNEIVGAATDERTAEAARKVVYMIDQSHCIEPKIPAMIRSVMNIQMAYAKALLVNREQLRDAQERCDVMEAEACVREAFEEDVRPLLRSIREEMGLPQDPLQAYLSSEYPKKIRQRGTSGSGWGV